MSELEQDRKSHSVSVSVDVNPVDDFVPTGQEYKNIVNRKKYVKKTVKVGQWNQRTAQSYKENGLPVPQFLDWEEKWFLNTADPKYPFEKVVTKIVRLRAVDYDSPKKELKDYIYYYEDWHGQDHVGRRLDVGDHLEGSYKEQIMEGVIYNDQTIGERRVGEKIRYYIPFSKKAVDDIIARSDASNKDTILYCVKGPRVRNSEYSYDQFVNMSFDDLVDINEKQGGPTRYPYDKTKQQYS